MTNLRIIFSDYDVGGEEERKFFEAIEACEKAGLEVSGELILQPANRALTPRYHPVRYVGMN